MQLMSKLFLHFYVLLRLGTFLNRNSSSMVSQLCPIVMHHQTIYIIFIFNLTYDAFTVEAKLLIPLLDIFLDDRF